MKKQPAKKPLKLDTETLRSITAEDARRVIGGRYAVTSESCNGCTNNGCP